MNGIAGFIAALGIFTLVNVVTFAILWARITNAQQWNSRVLDQMATRFEANEKALGAAWQAIAERDQRFRTLSESHQLQADRHAELAHKCEATIGDLSDRIVTAEARLNLKPAKTTPKPGAGTGSWADIRRDAEAGEQRLRREEENAKALQGAIA